MSAIDSAKADEGASYYRYRVSLRIWRPSGDPQLLTDALGLVPDTVHVAGQVIAGRGLPDRIAEATYWCHEFDASGDALDLEDFLAKRLAALRPRSDVFASVRAEGGDAELFVGFFPEHFNCGFSLAPALMRHCAECGLALSFDVYGISADADAGSGSV